MSYIIALNDKSEQLPIADIFAGNAPLEVDIGCGKGRFLIARAQCNPLTNYLGIDLKNERLLKAEKAIKRSDLSNIRLIKSEAFYTVDCLLPPDSVSTFYIFFPDPWPKRRHHKRRLIRNEFLDRLHKCMIVNGLVHIATDHEDYFNAILKTFQQDPRFDKSTPFERSEEEKTHFEIIFLKQNKEIRHCSFRKNGTTLQP